MNHQCDYCHKELNRLMFCNHSHQVMYHNKAGKAGGRKITATIIDEASTVKMCKHGRMIGLCEKGCK